MSGIYMIKNKINNKSYIGMTTRDINLRWKEHLKLAKMKSRKMGAIHKAINKYGVENFEFIILYETNSSNSIFKILCKKEIEYIELYGTYKNGYNNTKGGDGSSLFSLTDEQKQHLREINLGKKLSEEHRKAITNGLLKREYVTSDETKKKISQSQPKRPVISYYLDNGEIISIHLTQRDLANYFSIPYKKVNKVLKNIHFTLGKINNRDVGVVYKDEINLIPNKISYFKNNYSKRHNTKDTTLKIVM
jgi:group I intron endonuclease